MLYQKNLYFLYYLVDIKCEIKYIQSYLYILLYIALE